MLPRGPRHRDPGAWLSRAVRRTTRLRPSYSDSHPSHCRFLRRVPNSLVVSCWAIPKKIDVPLALRSLPISDRAFPKNQKEIRHTISLDQNEITPLCRTSCPA